MKHYKGKEEEEKLAKHSPGPETEKPLHRTTMQEGVIRPGKKINFPPHWVFFRRWFAQERLWLMKRPKCLRE